MTGAESGKGENNRPDGQLPVRVETRIDGAHISPAARGPTTSEPMARQLAQDNQGQVTSECHLESEQIQAQAGQLAAYLRRRQQTVDQREAQLNARMATVDGELRKGRMAISRRESELEQREAALAALERDLEERRALLAATERDAEGRLASVQAAFAEMDQARKRLRKREQRLDEAERQLRLQQEEHQRIAAELKRQRALAEEERCRGQRQVEQWEWKLAESHAKTAQLHQRMRESYRRWWDETKEERRRLALEHRQGLADLQNQRDALARRSRYVDHCAVTLEHLRAQLGEIHRETLQVRLATEELWAQLSGSTPSATLTESLVAIRKRLRLHFEEAAAELKAEKLEVDTARGEMAEHVKRFAERKRRMDGWAQRREEDLQQLAERLRARELEIAKREMELAESSHLREAERLAFQAEIDRLERRLEQMEPAGNAASD